MPHSQQLMKRLRATTKRRMAERRWGFVGEGLRSHHDAHRIDHDLVAGQLMFLMPKNAIGIAPKLWRDIGGGPVALRLHASANLIDVLNSHRILTGGFNAHTPLRSDNMTVSTV